MKKYIALFLIASTAFAATPSRFGDVVVKGATSIGTTAQAVASAALDVVSTTKGARPCPPMTQTQRDAITSPATGLCVYNSTTNAQNIYNGTAWAAVGSGGAGGGVNFIGQATDWTVSSTDDRDLNVTVGNWLAFANTVAGAQPDNGMTGGSPTVTCARSTTNPLDGAASLLITKGASNLQGNGCSVVFNVQPAYQGATATITASLNVSSGSIAQGDVKLFIYDVTNSKLITPSNNDVLSGPTLTATFTTTARAATPANQQYRLGVYFASTSATAVNLQLDNFSVSPGQAAYGMAGSNWISYTPTFTGFGTATLVDFYYRRVGDSMEVQGRFLSGTNSAVTALVSLPSGFTVDTTKLTANSTVQAVGTMVSDTASNNSPYSVIVGPGGFTTAMGFGRLQASLTALVGTSFVNSSSLSVFARFPIAGWDAGVSISPSQTYKISSYLASGTRVTTTPANLGEYRTMIRNTSANTYADTSGATITNADGMRIFNQAWATAATAGQPNRWDIFIGKNKNYRVDFYSSAGRTGGIDASPGIDTSVAFIYGVFKQYDPTTGVLSIFPYINSAATSTARIDVNNASAYFDVTVSDNALSVGMDALQVASTQKNMVLVGAQITCGNSSSAINSQTSGWTLSVSNGGSAGCCGLNYTGTFSAAPFISGCSNTAAGNSSCGFVSAPGINSVSVCGSQAGTLTNGTLSVWLVGPR